MTSVLRVSESFNNYKHNLCNFIKTIHTKVATHAYMYYVSLYINIKYDSLRLSPDTFCVTYHSSLGFFPYTFPIKAPHSPHFHLHVPPLELFLLLSLFIFLVSVVFLAIYSCLKEFRTHQVKCLNPMLLLLIFCVGILNSYCWN